MHSVSFNRWMRENAKYFLVAVCVIIMVTWLVPWSYFQRTTGAQGQGKIFGKVVPGQEVEALARTLSALSPRLQDIQRARAQAWEILILAHEAKQYGIVVGDDEVVALLKMRFPTESGVGFDANAYAQFLSRTGIPDSLFLSSLKSYLTSVAALRTVLNAVTLPEDEAWLWYAQQNERVKAAYIEISAEALAPFVPVDDKSLQAFYEDYKGTPPTPTDADANAIGYLEPEQVSIEYVLCPYSRYLDRVVVTERQVQAYYDAHKDQYALPTTADEAPKYKPLAEVGPQIEADLRRQDAARAVDEDMKEVNEEIANQTEVPFGSEEVRVADFAEIAKKFDLVHKITPLFSEDQAESVLPGARDLASKAFRQSAANIRRPSVVLSAKEGKFIFQTLKVQDPSPAPFEAVKSKVEKDYRMAKGYEMAADLADQALKDNPPTLDAAAAKVQAALADKLKAASATPEQLTKALETCVVRGASDFFGHQIVYGPYQVPVQTGVAGVTGGDFVTETFALKDNQLGKALVPTGARAAFIIERAGVKPADRADFDKNAAKIAENLLNLKRDAVRMSWLADARHSAQPSPEVVKYLTELQ